jgi:hypothetical protein
MLYNNIMEEVVLIANISPSSCENMTLFTDVDDMNYHIYYDKENDSLSVPVFKVTGKYFQDKMSSVLDRMTDDYNVFFISHCDELYYCNRKYEKHLNTFMRIYKVHDITVGNVQSLEEFNKLLQAIAILPRGYIINPAAEQSRSCF